MLRLDTNFNDSLIPPPIKPLPGQKSLFSAGSFFDDEAEPEPVVIETKPAEVTAETVVITAPFVDDTPPFEVPAEVVAVAETVEPTAPELPPITTSETPPAPMPVAPTVEERGTPAAEIIEVSREEAEYLYGQELQEMETELADLDLLVLAAKDELKKVSKEQQTAAKLLRGFKSRGVECYLQDLTEELQEAADEAAEAAAEAEQEANPKPSRDALSKDTAEEKKPFVPMTIGLNDEYWQNVSVRELKINPKIVSRLIESGIDTLEKLEWRRKGVHDGAEKWPTGIGTKKVDEIEDGIVKWFAEHQADKASADIPVNPIAAENDTTEPNPEPPKKTRKARKKKAEAEIYEDDDSDSNTLPNPAAAEDLTEEEHEANILIEMDALLEANDFKDPPDDAELTKKWDAGYEHCQQGNPVTYCIYTEPSWREAWIKGWLTADAEIKGV